MPSPWTEEKEKLLLLAMVQVFAPDKISSANWTRVAKRMGPEYTQRGVAVRYGKLVKAMKKPDASIDDSVTTPDKAEKVGTAKRKRPRREDTDEDGSDGAHGFEEPKDTHVNLSVEDTTPPSNTISRATIYEELKAAMDAVDADFF